MASTDYYEKIKHLQDSRHESEKQRLELEGRLNSYIKSDDRLAKLKAVRLQSYWKKICDDEERSRRRNEQLLHEFDRVEAHMAVLAERTQRQRRIKEDYEAYVERMYPNWKQKVMAQSVGVYGMPKSQPAPQPLVQFPNNPASSVGLPSQYAVVTVPQETLTTGSGQTRPLVMPVHSNAGQIPNSFDNGLQGRERNNWSYSDCAQDGPMSPGEFLPQGLLQQAPGVPPSTTQWARQEDPVIPSSSCQTSTSHATDPLYVTPAPTNATHSIDIPMATDDLLPDGSTALVVDSSIDNHVGSLPSSNLPQSKSQESPEDIPTNDDNDGSRSHGKFSNHLMEEFVSVASHESLPSRLPKTQSADVLSQGSDTSPKHGHRATDSLSSGSRTKVKIRGVTKKRSTNDEDSRESGGADDYTTVLRAEYQSVASLVSSDSERFIVQSTQLYTDNESVGTKLTHGPEEQDLETERITINQVSSGTLPQPDLTLDGFYNLLAAIQDNLPRTTSPEAYYRTLPTATSVKKEIIFNANKGAMLSHVNSTSISMVVKDQLPLLAANCESGALLPDKLFVSSKNIETVTEPTVRSFVHPTCKPFWDKLYEHMVLLRQHDIMNAKQIAQLFAELLISEDSCYEDKAQLLLSCLLDGVDVIQSPGSTSTSFVTPRRPDGGTTAGDAVAAANHMDDHDDHHDDHHNDDHDDNDDDDFFNQPLPTKPMGSLTDSVLYKQVKDEALKSHMQKSNNFGDDDDDDEFGNLDDMLSPHGGTGQQMTYNTTDGGDPTSTHNSRSTTLHSLGSTGGYMPSGLGSTGAYDPSGLESTGGYLPSGLDTGNSKSADQGTVSPQGTVSLGATGKSTKRRAAFKFGSSDEEDVEIPTSKTTPRDGVLEEVEDDEFEFYT